jgi:uncharacterized protein YdaU (DUF1376 family)
VAEKKKRTFEPLPYYPWFWRDWRASRAVQRMHHEARGLYRELLDECWVKGGIPDDAAACADIANCPRRAMERHWDAIRVMFTRAESGLLINERMEQERTESDVDRLNKSKGGKKGAETRKRQRDTERNTSSTAVQQQLKTSSTDSNRSSTSRAVHSRATQSSSARAAREPVAALAPSGARAPGMMSLADVDWRSQFEQAGVPAQRIGFRTEADE